MGPCPGSGALGGAIRGASCAPDVVGEIESLRGQIACGAGRCVALGRCEAEPWLDCYTSPDTNMSASQFCSSSTEFEHLTSNVYTLELFAQTEALKSLSSHFLLCRNIFVTLYLFFLNVNNKPYYKGAFSKGKKTLSLVFVSWDSELLVRKKAKKGDGSPSAPHLGFTLEPSLTQRDLCQELPSPESPLLGRAISILPGGGAGEDSRGPS